MKLVAAVFYHTNNKKQQQAAYDIIHFIYNSRDGKYLDNVRHPAKRGRANAEIQSEFGHRPQEIVVVEKGPELTNSSRLSQRITQLAFS